MCGTQLLLVCILAVSVQYGGCQSDPLCEIGTDVTNDPEYLPYRICDNPSPDVRLCNGSTSAEGRLQIRNPANDSWAEVCDDFFFRNEAAVIMRMMCWEPMFAQAHPGGDFDVATAGISLWHIDCDGTENDIHECFDAATWGIHPCADWEVAGASLCLPPDCSDSGVPPVPEVICEKEKIIVIFNREWDPTLETTHFSIYDTAPTCGYGTWVNNTLIIITIPIMACNTRRTVNATHMIYENTIQFQIPPTDGIVRPGTYALIPVGCIFRRLGNESLGPIEPEDPTPDPVWGIGEFRVIMRLFRDCLPNNTFIDEITSFPHPIPLGKRLFIALNLLTKDDLTLNVPTCWATTTIWPWTNPTHDLFRDNCRNDPTIIFYSVNTTMTGFSFQAFRFLGPYPFIYVHCFTFVCEEFERLGMCSRGCNPALGRRKLMTWGIRTNDEGTEIDTELGPVFFEEYPPSDDDLRDAPVATDAPPHTTTPLPQSTSKTTTTTKATTTEEPGDLPEEEDPPGAGNMMSSSLLTLILLFVIGAVFN